MTQAHLTKKDAQSVLAEIRQMNAAPAQIVPVSG
jgi:hypothetical protein